MVELLSSRGFELVYKGIQAQSSAFQAQFSDVPHPLR